nr:hypothetical protein Q903MT_gene427 [Picea sitchensis]
MNLVIVIQSMMLVSVIQRFVMGSSHRMGDTNHHLMGDGHHLISLLLFESKSPFFGEGLR